MSRSCPNEMLAEVLGIDLSSKDVLGFTVRARAGQLPTVTIFRYLSVEQIGAQKFTLTPENKND